MTQRLLVDMPRGCCKFVLFHVQRRLTRLGPLHKLAVACGVRVDRLGQSYCETHRAGLSEPARFPLSVPADRSVMSRAPRPFVCEEIR